MADKAVVQPDANAGKVNRRARQRQRLTMFVLGAVAIGFAFFGMFMSGNINKPAGGGGKIVMPGESVAAADLWQAAAERDLQELADHNQSLEGALHNLAAEIDSVKEELGNTLADIQSAQSAVIADELEQELLALVATETQAKPPAPVSLPAPPSGDNEGRMAAEPAVVSLPAIRFVRTVAATDEAGSDPLAAVQESAADMVAVASGNPGAPPLDHQHYLPGGTFMPAVILGGIDAPTATASRDNPHPVLLRVADYARLPNLARKDLRECFVLAAGYGDLSSERALLRTERMSCRRGDGTFFDAPVRGFVVGEDGRAGVRGRLVTKQGQVLAESFAAGIGAGFGEVARDSYTSQLRDQQRPIVATGANTQIEAPRLAARDLALAGFGSGASSALGRLSEYYIELAERLHPVIEVSAGRKVDIVLQSGVDLAAEPQLGK
ncbi:MAG: TraB/VirB10 family protein [Betaproteobacteria bacterium]|nr:TraB/VirB10 family protein [Betaproteobacteria bacterium]